MAALAERLAARTLELVDIPSESRNEAAIAAHVRSLVPASFALEYEAEDAFVWARPRREGARSSCSPATTTPFPRRRTSPAGSRTAPSTGSARAT